MSRNDWQELQVEEGNNCPNADSLWCTVIVDCRDRIAGISKPPGKMESVARNRGKWLGIILGVSASPVTHIASIWRKR